MENHDNHISSADSDCRRSSGSGTEITANVWKSKNNENALATYGDSLEIDCQVSNGVIKISSCALSEIECDPVCALLMLSNCCDIEDLCTQQNEEGCKYKACPVSSARGSTLCSKHRPCQYPQCAKFAQGGKGLCILHGGGHRCSFEGCNKVARGRHFCARHGGGKRCSAENCTKLAVGGSNYCASHGGGKKCAFEGCTTSAQSPTLYCIRHGGGRRCRVEGCSKVSRGKAGYCTRHNNLFANSRANQPFGSLPTRSVTSYEEANYHKQLGNSNEGIRISNELLPCADMESNQSQIETSRSENVCCFDRRADSLLDLEDLASVFSIDLWTSADGTQDNGEVVDGTCRDLNMQSQTFDADANNDNIYAASESAFI